MGDPAAGNQAKEDRVSRMPRAVHRIALPTPLAVGAVNAYVLTGEVPTLVDVGPGTPAALACLQEGLAQIGLDMSHIWQVVITHPHSDHAGLGHLVAELTGARILAHTEAVPWLADPAGAAYNTVRFLRTWGPRQGIPPDVLEEAARSLLRASGQVKGIAVSEPLRSDDMVMAGDDFWRVLYTPGHSSGHVCLYREEDGALISGDHLLPRVPSSTFIEAAPHSAAERVRSGLRYLASLSQVALHAVRTVLPGHGDPFAADGPGLVLDRIRAVRRKAEQALRLLQVQPATLWEICQVLFPHAQPGMMVFVLSNVAGYLDLLSANGQIARRNDGAVDRYVALEARVEIAV